MFKDGKTKSEIRKNKYDFTHLIHRNTNKKRTIIKT